jgi:hypothetical protein
MMLILRMFMCCLLVSVMRFNVAAVADGPVQVYILAGQSNMEGHARVETIDYIADDPVTASLHASMRGPGGEGYHICDNVWISYLTGRGGSNNGEEVGKLTSGYGSRVNPSEDGGKIGPEFTFGITLERSIDNPILIIKTAWGGKSLHTDFRPPSAGPFEFSEDAIERLEKQGKDVDEIKEAKALATGHHYRLMIDHVKYVLSAIGRVYPDYDEEQGYEIAGFVWFQGWNDMVDSGVYPDRDKRGGYESYSENLAHFIRDVRRDLNAPDMHFVIGVMGVGGPLEEYDNERNKTVHGNFRAAMAAPADLPEFKNNVTAVQTAPFWDAPLAAIDAKLGQVRQMAYYLRTKNANHANKDGSMSEAEQREFIDNYRAELISPEEEAMWKRGASNAGYHYLGCAKTMALIGQAFAEPILAAQEN